METVLWGLVWGLISAVSLPLGCLVALWKDPGHKVCAYLMAFGGGALLFALTLELFAGAINEVSIDNGQIMLVVCPSAIAGGLLFIFLNRLVNNWGSFLRKLSTKTNYLSSVPANIRNNLMRSHTLHQEKPTEWSRLLESESSMRTITRTDDAPTNTQPGNADNSKRHLIGGSFTMKNERVELNTILNVKAHTTTQVGIAIWLGILIDGIPESVIIGFQAASKAGFSVAFILGVFLSNFPEALSSSLEMQRQGMPKMKIFIMWSSLCIITGIGAMISAAVLPDNPDKTFILVRMGVEGLAAGAMLTMIAQTMLPEAFAHGGDMTGMAALLGFLASLTVSLVHDMQQGGTAPH